MITIFSLDQFHYEYVNSKYGDQAKLLLTDTNGFCNHIQTEDVYKDDMQEDQDLFDTFLWYLTTLILDYPQHHLLYSNTNKKVIGKSRMSFESIGLRAKMYSFMLDCGNEKKTA